MPRCKYGSKPKNFPGRANERRIRSLGRIERQLCEGVKRNSGATFVLNGADRARLNEEANALALRIMPHEQARSIRTKKDRRGRGKLSRTV